MISIHYLAISLITFLFLNTLFPKRTKFNLLLSIIPLISNVIWVDFINFYDQVYLVMIMFLSGAFVLDETNFLEESGYKIIIILGVFIECQSGFSNLSSLLIICLLNMVEISNLGRLKAPEAYVRQKVGNSFIVIVLMGITMLFSDQFNLETQQNAFLLLAFVMSGAIDGDYRRRINIPNTIDFRVNEVVRFIVTPYVFIKIISIIPNISGVDFNNVVLTVIFFVTIYIFISSQLRNSKTIIASRVAQINIVSIFLMKIYFVESNSGTVLVAILLNYCLYKLIINFIENNQNSLIKKISFGVFFAAPFSPFVLYKLYILFESSSLVTPTQSTFYILISFLPVLSFPMLTRERRD
jgi:hypothetical protein